MGLLSLSICIFRSHAQAGDLVFRRSLHRLGLYGPFDVHIGSGIKIQHRDRGRGKGLIRALYITASRQVAGSMGFRRKVSPFGRNGIFALVNIDLGQVIAVQPGYPHIDGIALVPGRYVGGVRLQRHGFQ